jgi:hypothetical protein
MKKWLCLPVIFYSLFCSAQTGSEIILFDLKIKQGQLLLSNGINITNHKGYDNQPSFHPSKPIIYYSSFDDSSRCDIKFYNYKTGNTSNLTVTREREYSPTVTPDGKFISCIIQRDNGAQDLGQFPIEGGEPQVLINNLIIGYHAWVTKEKLLLFVLGDSDRNTLHHYNLADKSGSVIAQNIGRSLHKVPGQNAMSFIQRMPDKGTIIQRFDISSDKISTLISTLPGQDHITWLQNNTLLSGHDSKLFSLKTGTDKEWKEISIRDNTILLKGITRLAVNKDNTKLAVVISE